MWVCGLPWKSTAGFEDTEDLEDDNPKAAPGFDRFPEVMMDAAKEHDSGGKNIGWVNYMMGVMWPSFAVVLKKKFVEQVTERASLELKNGGINGELQVDFEPGETTPRFSEIRTYEVEEDGISGLQVDVDMVWTTDDSFKIQPLFKGSKMGVEIKIDSIKVTHIKFQGTVSFVLAPLVATPPCFGAVQIFFFDPPDLDMKIQGLNGFFTDAWLKDQLQDIMRKTALNVMKDVFILPNRLMVTVIKDLAFDELVKIHSPLPKGLVEIEVLQGRDLIASDGPRLLKARSSDPFVVISLGDALMRTSTVAKDLNPAWQDGPDYLLVYNWNQMVQIEVFDADRFSNDDPIGCVPGYTVYRLCTEAENKPQGHWFDIKVNEKKGGQLLLRVRYLNLQTLRQHTAAALARQLHRRDTIRSRDAYSEALPHLVTVKLLGLEVDNPALLTEARATVKWTPGEDVDAEQARPSQDSLPGGAMPACNPRVLRKSFLHFQRFTSHAAGAAVGAATSLIAYKERTRGVPTERTSVKAKDWQGKMEYISTRKRGAVPVNVARAIAQLRDRDKFPLEKIADMFGLSLAATEAAANLRANFGVAWHQALHFLQGAGEQPGAGSVTIEVRIADRVAKAHHGKSLSLRNKEGLVGSVRADFRPEKFVATTQSKTLVCLVRAPLRREGLVEEEKEDDSDSEYFVNEELCDARLGRPVPSAVIEFSVELRSLTSGSCAGRLPGGQEPTPVPKHTKMNSRKVLINLGD